MTPRQQEAERKRTERLKKLNAKGGTYRACIGCHSGIVPWDQGSDYCTACIKRDR